MRPIGNRLVRVFVLAGSAAAICGCEAAGGGHANPYAMGADLRRLAPTRDRTLLKLSAVQQTTDYTCGPAALVTLLRFHGRDGQEMRIAAESNCSQEKGLDPTNLVNWLKRNGFEVTWGENGSLDLLRTSIGQGLPVLVEWIDWGGHWVLAVGYDTRGTETKEDDVILFADPADCHDGCLDGLSWFNAERFESMWFDAFLFGRPMHKLYVIARPAAGSSTQPAGKP